MPKVQMPQLGESVAEGTIGKWLKNVGDHVDKYEPIVEVITDKVNAEVPSPFEGTLTEILVQEGETVPNLAEIAVIEATSGADSALGAAARPPTGSSGAASDASPTSSASAESSAVPAGAPGTAPVAAERTVLGTGGFGPAGSDERGIQEVQAQTAGSNGANGSGAAVGETIEYEGRMTPAVRRLAREHGVDLARVQGSGHAGRVTREDVMRFVESGAAAGPPAGPAQPPVSGPGQPPASRSAQRAATGPAQPGAAAQSGAAQPEAAAQSGAAQPEAASPVAGGDALKPAAPLRKAIAAQMTRSLQVPVAYVTVEVDMSAVVNFREVNKHRYQAQEGVNLSYVAFVTKAVVEALRRHPDFNAHYTDEGHWLRKRVNVGIAVAVEDGLVVPVIHDADQLSIHGLNQAIYDVAERARANKLKLEDIQGGTFTVDNTGWTGSVLTQPIINVPEVAIVTMEAIVKRPVVVETPQGDAFAVRHVMNMCLGIDHRATDGAQAGRFIGDVKRWLESVDSGTAIW